MKAVRGWGMGLGLAAVLAMAAMWLGATVHAADAAPAPAGAAAEGAAAGGAGTSDTATKQPLPEGPLQMIIASGFIGYMICLLSVVLVALIIENLVAVKQAKLIPEDLLEDIEAALDNGEYEEALEICQSEDCMLTRVLEAGLNKMSQGIDRMGEAMNDEANAQATLLHQKLGYISMIAGIAPMMGLLGTVQGMVGAFGTIARTPTANAQDLAGGIYVALMTTLEGLLVAIPATVAFTFFRGRAVKITMAMGTIMSDVLDRFRPAAEE